MTEEAMDGLSASTKNSAKEGWLGAIDEILLGALGKVLGGAKSLGNGILGLGSTVGNSISPSRSDSVTPNIAAPSEKLGRNAEKAKALQVSDTQPVGLSFSKEKMAGIDNALANSGIKNFSFTCADQRSMGDQFDKQLAQFAVEKQGMVLGANPA